VVPLLGIVTIAFWWPDMFLMLLMACEVHFLLRWSRAHARRRAIRKVARAVLAGRRVAEHAYPLGNGLPTRPRHFK
jgi:hypothetical protein